MREKWESIMDVVLDIPDMIVSFLVDHPLLRALTSIVLAVAASVLTTILLVCLAAAGYIPSPWR